MNDPVLYHTLTAETAALLQGAAVFDNPVDPEKLAAFVADPGHLLVFATVGSQVAGFASGTLIRHPDKPVQLFINEVGVSAPFRRRGIARSLCVRLMELGRARGCRSAWLGAEPDDAPANALYRGLGGAGPAGAVIYEWLLDPGS